MRKFLFLLPCLIGAAGLFSARAAGDGTPAYYLLLCGVAAVYLCAWIVWGDRRALSGPGRAGQLAAGCAAGGALALVFLVGAVVVSAVPALSQPAAELFTAPARGGLAPTLFVLVINGAAEELVYRDVVPRQLQRRGLVRGPRPAGVAAVVLYPLMTVSMGVVLLLLGAAALGSLCQWLAARTGRLLAPIAAHLTWSTTMLVALPHLL